MAKRKRRIEVADYDPAWPGQFEDYHALFSRVLGPLAVAVEHVGSTSVPGLPAKPILDIDVVIESRADLPAVETALATLGYEHMGDLGIPGREAYSGKGVPRDGSERLWPPHNLYVCARDNLELKWHLAFRDYLRTHPEAAAAYAEHKRELAAAHPHDIDAYVDGKEFFIRGCLRAALELAGEDGDAPAGAVGREISAYYGKNAEAGRLGQGRGQLEMARTRELLGRYLPAPPATVLDVGGGPGTHATWLARDGYTVHLVDPMANLLREARAASAQQPRQPIASITRGEARALSWVDDSADAVLLLGPLYHLTQRPARVAALAEARRVVRPGGPVLVAGVSRFSSALDGLVRRFLDDASFVSLMERDLREGQHRSSPERGRYFTTAYLHRPEELAAEMGDAGLTHEGTFAIEGPLWMLQDFEEQWQDEVRRERMLSLVRAIESEPSLLGASGHLLAVGRA